MKIGIDALPLLDEVTQGMGITSYVSSMISKLIETDNENFYYLYFRVFR